MASPVMEKSAAIDVIEKATGRVIGRVPYAGKQDVDAAIARAKEAFKTYSQLPAHRRARILESASAILTRDRDEIATIICREAGKAWKYSTIEVERAAETFKFAAEEAKRIHGETIPLDASTAGEGRLGFYMRVPMGVIVAISPFNFPLNLVAHKLAPALAAGNTVVLKPASTTPLTAMRLAAVLKEAGLPEHVLEIVCGGGRDVGAWLVSDPRPVMVTFTGSPGVGAEITRMAGLKKMVMELGNNGGVIIEPDADLDAAIPRCVMSSFANSGQVCISLQRLYVHRRIAEDFIRRFVDAVKRLKVGDPLEKDCDVGP
ncbi:MAG: aldehyde dehydrogenase family protein, partial [Elusimicrobiota bacterium]